MKKFFTIFILCFLLISCKYKENNKDFNSVLRSYDIQPRDNYKCFFNKDNKIEYIYKYNENGSLNKLVSFNQYGKLSFIYDYDDYKNKIKETYYINDNELIYYYINEYDMDQLLIRKSKYDKNHILLEYEVYSYMEYYGISSIIGYGPNHKLKYEYYFNTRSDSLRYVEYDSGKKNSLFLISDDENSQKTIKFNSKGMPEKNYKYDLNTNELINTIYYQSGGIEKTIVYNKFGKKKMETIYNRAGVVINKINYDYLERIMSLSKYKNDSSLDYYLIYEYDDLTDKVRIKAYDRNHNLLNPN